MVEKLRIVVVVRGQDGFPVGSIIFCDGDTEISTVGRYDRQYYPNIDLTLGNNFICTYGHDDDHLISTVIDTATAKGDDTLGAFLCMVYHYRVQKSMGKGLDWDTYKGKADPAYRALQSLYEHGPDDSITIKFNNTETKISRISAEAMIESLRAELKWGQR